MRDVSRVVAKVLGKFPDADPADVESACWRAWARTPHPGYVYKAGVNAAIDAHRTRTKRNEVHAGHTYLSGSTVTTPEEIVVVQQMLTNPVARLLFEGWSQEDIAVDLGKTRHQVRQELERLREVYGG